MKVAAVFKSVIEPDLERIPVLELVHREVVNGRDITVCHIVRRNVFTDFDRKLSRHLAATRGKGFPQISVETRICENEERGEWRSLKPTSHESVPATLAHIAERAFGGGERALVTVYQGSFSVADRSKSGIQRELSREDVEVMAQALTMSRLFGEAEFVEINGDFNMITMRPAGDSMAEMAVDLFNRLVSIPVGLGASSDVVEAPLYGLEDFVASNYDARVYVAKAQRALAAAKEDAVCEFRAAAEERIRRFDEALRGRPLDGHRIDAMNSLVARLRAGLGDQLAGISEDARITALDWSAEAASEEVFEATPGMRCDGVAPKETWSPARGQDWVFGAREAVAG